MGYQIADVLGSPIVSESVVNKLSNLV
jgi:hypothetical protein